MTTPPGRPKDRPAPGPPEFVDELLGRVRDRLDRIGSRGYTTERPDTGPPFLRDTEHHRIDWDPPGGPVPPQGLVARQSIRECELFNGGVSCEVDEELDLVILDDRDTGPGDDG